MKTNKSFLLLFAASLFVLSSCTQARYGHMTRRSKASNNTERVASQPKSVKTEAVAPAIVEDVIPVIEEVALSVEGVVEVPNSPVLPNPAVIQSESAIQPTAQTLQQTVDFSEKLPAVLASKRVKTQVKKASEKLGIDQSADNNSLIRLILIIILILLILNLIGKLLPGWFSGILGLVLLILIVLWLLGSI